LIEDSDQHIIDLIGRRDRMEEGFRLLLSKYKERVYWHVRRMVLSHEDANDVSQEIFIKIFKNLRNFKGDSGLYTWIYSISVNESLSFLRKKKTRPMSSEDPGTMSTSLIADKYFDEQAASRILWNAIESLPEKQKIVFKLKYFDEMPYRDMSETLQTSEGALKASYHHAVKKIENYIHENGFREQ